MAAADPAGNIHEVQISVALGMWHGTEAVGRSVYCQQHGHVEWVTWDDGVKQALDHLMRQHGAHQSL